MDLIVDGPNAARINQIEQIPRVRITDNDTHSSCSICISDFTKNEIILILPCVHKFHRTCIQTWLFKNNSCPSCRESVFEDLDPVWDSDASSDESVDVVASFSFHLDNSMNSAQNSSDPDWDVSVASDVSIVSDVSEVSSNDSDMSSMIDPSMASWGFITPSSPADTLSMNSESGDSSNEASDDSSDETDVMNESQITVSSESENSEQSDEDSDGVAFPISSDESSDSDVMLYESSESSD